MRTRQQSLGDKNLIGARVEQLRRDKGLKQRDLLIKLEILGIDLDASGLSKIEGQHRSVSDFELVAISQALDVPVSYLLGLAQ
jgi:transcriptional regulator with XRE-family HTH domain